MQAAGEEVLSKSDVIKKAGDIEKSIDLLRELRGHLISRRENSLNILLGIFIGIVTSLISTILYDETITTFTKEGKTLFSLFLVTLLFSSSLIYYQSFHQENKHTSAIIEMINKAKKIQQKIQNDPQNVKKYELELMKIYEEGSKKLEK